MNKSHSQTGRLVLALVAASTFVISLAGCSLGFTPQRAESPRATANSPAPDSSASDDSSTASDDGSALVNLPTRDSFIDAVTAEVTCAGGTQELSSAGQVVAITADCAAVSVTAPGVVVLAENIDQLTVDATGAVIFARELGLVAASGAANVVTWQTGSPTIGDEGFSNTFVRSR